MCRLDSVAVSNHPDLAGIQVVLPAGVEPFNHWNSDLIRCCVGGQTRRDSVLAGCRALLEQVDKDTPVLVHDAARPLYPKRLKSSAFSRAIGSGLLGSTGCRHAKNASG